MKIHFLCLGLGFLHLLPCLAHSDPAFFGELTNYRHLAGHCVVPWSNSPGLSGSPNRWEWLAAVTNHNTIAGFNTLRTTVTWRQERTAFTLSLKHSPLPENDYYRTQSSFATSVALGGNLTGAVELSCCRFRLPELQTSAWWGGTSVALAGKPAKRLLCGLAVGSFFLLAPDDPKTGNCTRINTDLRYEYRNHHIIALSAEMLTGLPPSLLVSWTGEVHRGIRISAGVGTGGTLLTLGFFYDIPIVQPGVASSFTTHAGASTSLLLTGNHGQR